MPLSAPLDAQQCAIPQLSALNVDISGNVRLTSFERKGRTIGQPTTHTVVKSNFFLSNFQFLEDSLKNSNIFLELSLQYLLYIY